ncbi:three-Cys-motif partner protein TcmP [Sphingomonas sp. SM33]|uniref:Three-Cys-motif partner protein TcmP n=1 Tax=Sphingomonas telluris TaxID=2907998 RepID=A0ABS9VPN8_9SPHN|nr:three-Cys-motif partner protein TcmP [Sphingomonas telluris]MCH8616951.1 three-Cys-motif partner protein TcmP [Sphingomonas telluris]
MTRTAQEFGDEHTKKKLETVEAYLRAFTIALKRQNFTLYYVDAYAGSGASVSKQSRTRTDTISNQVALGISPEIVDTDEIVQGSATRALSINPPFDRYLFNDVKRSNVRSLAEIVRNRFPHLQDRVEITQQDANAKLRALCSSVDWKCSRAVVFLDPFGLQIKYDTLCELARTKAVDLWYLVPVFAMYRQIRTDGQVIADGGRSVDEALGTDAWREVVVDKGPVQNSLFGEPVELTSRAVDIAWFEKVARERLNVAFNGRVVDRALPLGRNGLHEFSLMFASANPSGPAWALASKLAKAVLK